MLALDTAQRSLETFGALFSERDRLRNECGSSHDLDGVETNSCANTEGFADYAAVVSWYDPNVSGVAPWGWAFDFEDATLTSSNENYESGEDGVNMHDYYDNNAARFPGIFTTFISHNCLLYQDIN